MKRPEPNQAIKVAIADDHALFRAGVKTALAVKKDVELIAEADNGQQLLHLLKHVEPDVILLDIQMPIMDGVAATRAIREREKATGRPRTPILAVTANAMTHQVAEYEAAGMDGMVPKPIDIAALFAAMEQALEPPADASANQAASAA